MQRSLLRLGQGLMLAVLLAASGGHWMVLQSLAWTRMLVSYSQSGDLAEAVSKTFDGRHPCSLCKKIEQAKNSESPQQEVTLESQASFVIPSRVTVMNGAGSSWEVEVPQKRSEQRFEQPGAPPPRSALA